MTSRERFRAAINHQQPDRVPIDVGQDAHNGIHAVAYGNLIKHLGIEDTIKFYEPIQHLAACKESVLERLGADTRYVFAQGPQGYEYKIDEEKQWADEWRVVRKNIGLYDEGVVRPLAGCTMDDVKNYFMHDPKDPHRFIGLRDKAKSLYENTDYALIGGTASLFYLGAEFIGFQEYMEMILLEPEIIEALTDRILGWMIDFFDAYLDEIGEYLEMVWIGDDWGTQIAPIMNPAIFRQVFVSRYKQFTSSVKRKFPNLKICLHSCGSVLWAMQDFIDAGIDVLHPLQAAAAEMGDAARIKQMYGDKLAFYSGLPNQTTIPYGTPEQVDAVVREKISAFAPGGGYIISAGHNIQADVPPQNILALFDAARKYGVYPIK